MLLLVLGSFGTPGAAAGAGLPLVERPLLAAPTGDYLWHTWEVRFATGSAPTVWPDATVRTFGNDDGASAGFGPGYTTALDPFATGPVRPSLETTAAPYDSRSGLTDTLSDDRFFGPTAIGSGGRIVSLERIVGSSRVVLVQRDERSPRQITGRGLVATLEAVALVPTAAGLRGVLVGGRAGDREASRTQVVDAAGERVAYLGKLSPQDAVALRDGSLLVVGDPNRGRALARVWPGRGGRPGKVRYLNVSGQPAGLVLDATPLQGYPGVIQTVAGPVARLRDRRNGAADAQALARVSGTGRMVGTRRLGQMGIDWPAGCIGDGVARELIGFLLGPSGLPMVNVRCAPATNPRGVYQSVTIELTRALRFRQLIAATGNGFLRTMGTLPDGRLFIAHPDGSVGAVTVPGALPVTQGRITGLRARRKDASLVTIVCQRPYGAICSGVVEVRGPGGAFFGWAPYALPGRPGKARTSYALTVPRSAAVAVSFPAGLPRNATAALRPLPATFERGGPTPPPNPAPLTGTPTPPHH